MKRDIVETVANDAATKIYKEGFTQEGVKALAEETLKLISTGIEKYAQQAHALLRELDSYGIHNKTRASSLSKHKKIMVANAMKRAYKLIMEFRAFITNEKIEYLIQLESKNLSTIAILTTQQILDSISTVETESGGGLKLNIHAGSIRDIILNDPSSQLSEQLINAVKMVLEQIIEINQINNETLTQEQFNQVREKMTGKTFTTINPNKKSWINQGYALEAALKIVIETDDITTLENIPRDKRYAAYFEAIENIATYRSGGDIGVENVEKLQKKAQYINQNFKTLMSATQLQVKRIRQKAAAQLVTLRSIMADLSIIILLHQIVKTGPNDQMLKRFNNFFTDSRKSTVILEEVKKEIAGQLESNAVVQEVFNTLERFFGSK